MGLSRAPCQAFTTQTPRQKYLKQGYSNKFQSKGIAKMQSRGHLEDRRKLTELLSHFPSMCDVCRLLIFDEPKHYLGRQCPNHVYPYVFCYIMNHSCGSCGCITNLFDLFISKISFVAISTHVKQILFYFFLFCVHVKIANAVNKTCVQGTFCALVL